MQGVKVDGGEPGVVVGAGRLEATLAEAADEVLDGGQDIGVDGEQELLSMEEIDGDGGHLAPELLGAKIASAEIEEGLLAD